MADAVGKNICIMGSTGSIGTSTVDVVNALGPEYRVTGLCAHSSWEAVAEQAQRLDPSAVAIADPALAPRLRDQLDDRIDLLVGEAGLVELATRPDSNFIVAAIVGAAGLPSTIAAVRAGKTVGLANKEALVVAGGLLMPLARKSGSQVLPIDSEHSAIFQGIAAGKRDDVHKIYLTASGGPFRTWSAEQIAEATLEDALRHPTWDMGPKITIDSATMMNKALEIIEAHWLFGLPADRIEVLVHPESIIHSMVEFKDGSVIAQMGTPDMRTPIQYTLTYPDREIGCASRLDFSTIRRLNFEMPDVHRFPALRLAYDVVRAGGTAGAVFNGANESAVELFRAGRIRFGQIVMLIEQVLQRHAVQAATDLETLLEADRWARQEVIACLET
jgi:1-deoxy-D-xylulose-5-phosphate reductoisomerase